MMDVVANYDPDFIYTDGTVQGPFTGDPHYRVSIGIALQDKYCIQD